MPFIDLTLIGLPSFKSQPRVTDGEASTLYKLWRESPPGQPISAKRSDVRQLISKGLLQSRGEGTKFALTPDGREVIAEMVTSEPNKFAVDAKMPSYKEIKLRARRARQTFIKRAMKIITSADMFGFHDPNELSPEELRSRMGELAEEDPAAAQELSTLIEEVKDPDAAFNEVLTELLQCLKQKKEMARLQEPQVRQQEPQEPAAMPMMASTNVIVKVAGFDS